MNKGDPRIGVVCEILAAEFAERYAPIVDLLAVHGADPYRVLVATILSSRTKDGVTAAAACRLFARADDFIALAALTEAEIGELIFPVGFYRTKARHLRALPSALASEFGGEIPRDVDALTRLPGVGRKTANLVAVLAFGIPAVCVDVHVHRIFNRLGYVSTKTPLETERELRRNLPKELWTTFNKRFVSFGQRTCLPIKPRCGECPVARYCASRV